MSDRVHCAADHRRHLLSEDWELCQTAAGAYANPPELARADIAWTPAHAPSTVAECLRDANLWSLDEAPRRFDAHDWWYRTRFPAPAHSPGADVVLGFDGLATIADVWLNGVLLLSGDNMFVAHERRLEAPLAANNELVIRFRALDKLLEARRPRPKWRAPMVENQQLRWFRTTLLGRTPGWSPAAAPVGPWRPVWIEVREHVRVANLTVHNGVAGRDGWLEVSANVSGIAAAVKRVTLTVARMGASHSAPLQRTEDGRFTGRLDIPSVELWWPHTHGEPALYDVSLLVDVTTTVAIDLGRTGFRTLQLDQEQGDFALRVNGVPVFCRGACWTPDPVSLRESPESLRETLAQLRAAGMNMLRIGGTMAYESDAFLDHCDAHGILLWQDFMFANMNYPEEDTAFMESVDTEARQQLARLAARPCVTVLCGNSEGEQQAAMWGAPRESWTTLLFHERLPALVREICPDVPYWPSSAHGGTFPHQGNVGTTSYYGVGAYLRPLEDARRAEVRFASECLAFANIPEEPALARMPGGLSVRAHHPAWKARTPRDLGAGWDFDDVRDHYVARLFGVEPMQLRYADHERYLTLGRVATGEVMAAVFAEWRRKRSTCRGGLLWFWRDLWCGAGWGIIDALGAPKAAYHYLRRALQPVSVSISDEGCNGLYLHVTNEKPAPLHTTLEVALFRGGETVVGNAKRELTVPAHETLEIAAGALFPGFLDLSYAYRFGPPQQDLVIASLCAESGALLAQHVHFVGGIALQMTGDPGLSATARAVDSNFEVTVTTRGFAQSVWLEAAGFEADDAYFHMAPGASKTVLLQPSAAIKPRALRGRVRALNTHAAAKIG